MWLKKFIYTVKVWQDLIFRCDCSDPDYKKSWQAWYYWSAGQLRKNQFFTLLNGGKNVK